MTTEPRIGWEQSVERNRLDAVICAAMQIIRDVQEATGTVQTIPADLCADLRHDLVFAHGFLEDARETLATG